MEATESRKMEDQQETLMDSLKRLVVSIPNDVGSLTDLLNTSALFSICAQCVNLLGDSSSFPTSLPDSTEEKFKLCTDVSASIKSMGFVGDLSFYEFLHPTEEDSYKLMRFLLERLSEASAVGKAGDHKQSNGNNPSTSMFEQKLRRGTEVSDSSCTDPEDLDDLLIEKAQNGTPNNLKRCEKEDCAKGRFEIMKTGEHSIEESNEAKVIACGRLIGPSEEQHSEERGKVVDEELKEGIPELQHLEDELELLKAAAEMALSEDHPIDFYVDKLNGNIDAKRKNLIELELQGNAIRTTLEEKKTSLEGSIYGSKGDLYEKFQHLKAVERETDSVLSETQKREKEICSLSAELKQQLPRESRKSYIERIKEITKNSRKQEADIERILRDTRELQLESNSIPERLHRTYAIADETIFREAKKDQVRKQAYRLLTSIHETFEQIRENVLATDRLRREIAEHEKKLAVLASRSSNIDKLQADLDARSSNIDKLQADLDALIKENEYLEQCLLSYQN